MLFLYFCAFKRTQTTLPKVCHAWKTDNLASGNCHIHSLHDRKA